MAWTWPRSWTQRPGAKLDPPPVDPRLAELAAERDYFRQRCERLEGRVEQLTTTIATMKREGLDAPLAPPVAPGPPRAPAATPMPKAIHLAMSTVSEAGSKDRAKLEVFARDLIAAGVSESEIARRISNGQEIEL